MEYITIKLNFSMDHAEGQDSPATEIARILHAAALQIGAGDLEGWREVQDMRGSTIGEMHFATEELDT